MTEVVCESTLCVYNEDGKCNRAYINFEYTMSAAGFILECRQEQEKQDA